MASRPTAKQDTPKNAGRAPAVAKDPAPGPVPYHRRAKLGATDTERNPFGEGPVSTVSTVNCGGKRGW
jgi:hypothetical protein